MPDFIGGIRETFLQAIRNAYEFWDTIPITTRLLGALLLAGFGVYLGSRSERGGLSAIFFLGAFGLFAYVMALGIALIR